MLISAGYLTQESLSKLARLLNKPSSSFSFHSLPRSFSALPASTIILETNLADDHSDFDLSFQFLKHDQHQLLLTLEQGALNPLLSHSSWQKVLAFCQHWPSFVTDTWLEMDQSEHHKPLPLPCFFFDVTTLKVPGDFNHSQFFSPLAQLLGNEMTASLQPALLHTIHALPPNTGFYQIGVMLARHQDRVRLFTLPMKQQEAFEWLDQLKWLTDLPPHKKQKDHALFPVTLDCMVDVDVTQEGTPEKVGFNIGLTEAQLSPFMDHLTAQGWCTPAKNALVTQWKESCGVFPGKEAGYCALIHQLSHIKITFQKDHSPTFKVYLKSSLHSFKKQLLQASTSSF